MRHPESGIVIKCGTDRGDAGQQQCMKDFKEQGFERVP